MSSNRKNGGDDNSDKVETTARLAQWRINNMIAPTTCRMSCPFKMGRWNWLLCAVRVKNRELFFRLYPQESKLTYDMAPIASFLFRVVSLVGDCKVVTSSETKDRLVKNFSDFVFRVGVPLAEKFIVEVEFRDLKIAPLCGGEPRSIWGREYTEERWNKTALSCLSRVLKESIHTDITITASDGSIRAHRAILASRSPVFYNMFFHDLKEKRMSTIDIIDMSIEDCQVFLHYMYGHIKHEEFQTHRLALLHAADKYVVADLKEACLASLEEDIDENNVLERLQIASFYQLPRLKSSCLKYLVTFSKIFDIRYEFDAFMQSADRDLIREVFHEVLNTWKGF